jgi:hypothetical protein
MKKLFLEYLNKQLAKNQAMLSTNSLSEDDKKLVEDAIADLQATIEAVDALEGENQEEAISALKETVENLQQGLTAVQEKLQQQHQEQTEQTMPNENYLQSKNSVADFASAIRNAKTSEQFRANWSEYLSQNGITISAGSEAAFIPEAVKGQIQDIWDRNADWLKDLNDTGAKRFYCRYNTSDQTAETSRAKGWKQGTTKVGQTINVAAKLLEPQFIYKLVEIDLKTKFDSDEALITYVLNELVDQILYEIKRAILVGDGRAVDSNYKINKFEAIAKTSSDNYTTVSTVTENGFLVDDMRTMVDNIKNDNNSPIYVFMSKASLRTLSRVQASETSTPVYLGIEQVAEQIGATRIITTDLLGSDYKAVAMIPNQYLLVGENILNPVLYTFHEGYENLDVYRYECVAGGGIQGLKSTAVLKAE